MNSRQAAAIDDILQATQRLEVVRARGRSALDADYEQLLIAERLLEVVGEASQRLIDNDFAAQHPHLPFVPAKTQRNWIAHHYDDIDTDVIWQSMTVDVPEFAAALRAIRDAEGT